MTKKQNDFLEEPEDIVEEVEEKFEYTPKESPKIEKNPFKILNIIGNEFVLMDKNGNGIRQTLPIEPKSVKIGDTIYL